MLVSVMLLGTSCNEELPDEGLGERSGDALGNSECSLLFDEAHNNWDRLSHYDLASEALVDRDFSLASHVAGPITAETLAETSVLYLNEPAIEYSAAEIGAIQTWVEGGGGLFVASDCGNVHLINVAITPYGIGNFGQCVGGLDELPLIDHEAVGDSDTYWFNVGSALGADGNWTALASRNGQPTLAAREFGEGRVVVSGDNDGFSYGLGYSPVGMAAEDNALLYANLATWLCDPGCRLPPGLEKNGKSPPGLQNASGLHGECPPGWEHGEKQGWDD